MLKARLASLLEGEERATAASDPMRATLSDQLDNGTRFPSPQALADFYAKHGDRLLWSDSAGKLAPRAEALLAWIRRAGEHGLVPEDYAIEPLEALQRRISKRSWDGGAATRLADFDLLATSALFRYASDLSGGRIQADDASIEWRIKRPAMDLPGALDAALENDDLGKLFESLPPPHPGYARLRGGLEKLRAAEAAGGWPIVPEGPKLSAGSRGSRVHLLRQRLLGESAPSSPSADDAFDANLEAAVRRFQSLHGIDADGVAGEGTIRELNVPVADRIRQAELNLERWRWMPRDLGDTHVLVNIPAFELKLMRDDTVSWSTRIVAGKAFTPTPVFSDRIVGIVVHPPWNVPESIAVGEYLPELIQDRDALSRRHLRLLQGEGEKTRELDPRDIDWKGVNPEHFPYHLRQDPGDENPLGVVKFVLTNDFHVYLHDTPSGHLFSRSERDLSHGCIRVEHALQFADEITGGSRRDEIREALDQPDERLLQLKEKIPVYIVYWTAWADEAGDLHFGPDVYGFDGPQWTALDRHSARSAPLAALTPKKPA